ncbi:MAG: hypothetical protein H6R17_3078 [Proteobacteria bacterium]|nr:hypothetical protein [Pseudomonadota bacterium]
MRVLEQKRYSFRVTYPISDILDKHGFGKVADVPFIQDSTLNYHQSGSRFLIDRALAKWPKPAREITPATIKTNAEALCNYLDWCDARTVDPITAEYLPILIGRYQREMTEGDWSASGDGLSAVTINQRIDVALEFQQWAAYQGLRPEVEVPTKTITRERRRKGSGGGRKAESIEVRRGKMRINKRTLGMPSEEAVGAWLQRIYLKPVVGGTEGLMCETVLETAIRRAEVAGLRKDFLPADPNEWPIVDRAVAPEHQMVFVTIRYGTKGPKYGTDHGDKIGPEQIIKMPMKLALRLHHYRNTDRPKAVMVAVKDGKTAAEQRRIRDNTVHLFINPNNGERYTPSRVYDAWRSVPLPQRGWSVHSGRDFWACTTLWRAMVSFKKLFEEALERKLDDMIVSLFKSTALSVIELQIQPQLRHVDRDTTMIYLQWIADRLGVALDLHQNYVESLATEGDDEEG